MQPHMLALPAGRKLGFPNILFFPWQKLSTLFPSHLCFFDYFIDTSCTSPFTWFCPLNTDPGEIRLISWINCTVKEKRKAKICINIANILLLGTVSHFGTVIWRPDEGGLWAGSPETCWELTVSRGLQDEEWARAEGILYSHIHMRLSRCRGVLWGNSVLKTRIRISEYSTNLSTVV